MPSRLQWQSLLQHATTAGGLAALARAFRFGDAEPLGAAARTQLGIPAGLGSVDMAPGPGTTRALLVVSRDPTPARDQLRAIAGTLVQRAPHFLWLALFAVPDRRELVMATWNGAHHPASVSAIDLDLARLHPSDLDTAIALASVTSHNDLLVHTAWLEILGREALSSRFYMSLERLVVCLADAARGDATPAARADIALLHVCRLLFLAFLQTRGWLDGDPRFLANAFDRCMASGGSFDRRVLRPLFFGTLNTPVPRRAPAARALGRLPFLNGGLFQRSALERRAGTLTFRDEDWAPLFDDLLLRYRFTPREEVIGWSETAIDPEMLGRAFESLMAARARRDTGAFFTPPSLVERAADGAIGTLLAPFIGNAPDLDRALRGELSPEELPVAARDALRSLRVLDPACGSGAFLVCALERVTALRRMAGDARPLHVLRRRVVAESLFGVDVNPTAVWLCELRLWLAVTIDDPERDPLRLPPLPNLDHNIRCGDALAGGDFTVVAGDGLAPLARVRVRYARATGARKRSLARQLEQSERSALRTWLEARLARLVAERRALLAVARGRDLFGGRRGILDDERDVARQLRLRAAECRRALVRLAAGGPLPFAFASHFPDIAARGGFDLVLGNPPWVRLHRIPCGVRERLRRDFEVYRHAAWESGARAAGVARGFAGQVDLSALFVERSLALARSGGAVALLLPAKLWKSLAGGGTRRIVQAAHELRQLEDWSGAPALFDAAVYPSLVVVRRRDAACPASRAPVSVTVHRRDIAVSWRADAATLALDESPGAPWVLLPPAARAAFDRLSHAGRALVDSGIGDVTLGVKCGVNEAFVARLLDRDGPFVWVGAGDRRGRVESAFIRPLLRGESIRAWHQVTTDACLVFPYDADGRLLTRLPPCLRQWLLPWQTRLRGRADARGSAAWWSLFRTTAARADRPRVVWADLGRSPQALVLPAGDPGVPLNTCYVVRCRDDADAGALAAVLNSPVAAAWLGALAEPARGNYARFLAWTVSRLPLPDDWDRARTTLAPLAVRARAGNPPSSPELLEAVLHCFRLRHRTIAPLLEWMAG